MTISARKAAINRAHPLSIVKQCRLVSVSRSSVYTRPRECSERDAVLMRRIDEIHIDRPFLGSRHIRDVLIDQGHGINRKKVQRLM